MKTLSEIKAAAATLTSGQKQELLLSLAKSLRSARRHALEPRLFAREQLAAWIAEDVADMQGFRDGG